VGGAPAAGLRPARFTFQVPRFTFHVPIRHDLAACCRGALSAPTAKIVKPRGTNSPREIPGSPSSDLAVGVLSTPLQFHLSSGGNSTRVGGASRKNPVMKSLECGRRLSAPIPEGRYTLAENPKSEVPKSKQIPIRVSDLEFLSLCVSVVKTLSMDLLIR